MSVQQLSSTELGCEDQVLCSVLGVQNLTKRLGVGGGGGGGWGGGGVLHSGRMRPVFKQSQKSKGKVIMV